MQKVKVNLLIGDKSPIYNKTQSSSGESRHHESPFFELLKNKVQFNKVKMYSTKLPFPSRINHLLHHLIHPFSLKPKLDKKAITHILFGEEASLLKFIKPSHKSVVTCLDLIPILYPEGISKLNQLFQKWCLKGLKKADHIITNSEFTKKEVHNYFKIPNHKITVIYPALNENLKPLPEIPENFHQKHNLSKKKDYLLYVGALDLPRKNLKTLLKAFSKTAETAPELDLILIGHAYHQERFKQLLSPYQNIKPRIHIFNNIPNEDLPIFYNLATIFVFPTLYEGFGLPPAEAMACGTPVITTDQTSIPEVVGNAAIVVPKKNLDHLDQVITKTYSSKKLLKELSEKGLKQVKKFNWQNHTEKTYDLYRKLQ